METIVKRNYVSKGELPRDGQYVLGRVIDRTWEDKDDTFGNRFWVVVKFKIGLTKEERKRLPESEERKKIFRSEDEDGNNTVGFYWKPFGPGSFFGQEINEWVSLDNLSVEEIND